MNARVLLLSAVAAVTLVGPALATDLSLNTASFTYDSFDASGAAIANNIAVASGDQVTNNDVPFWTATTTFNLDSIVGETLSISNLSVDDRAVVELNGTPVAAAGIYGAGAGSFLFTPTGASTPYTFSANGSQTVSVAAPFQVGSNTLEIIVNNTNNGIYGGLTTGPSSLAFSGSVTGGVPEPTSWALMLVGFGLAGSVMRRRSAITA